MLCNSARILLVGLCGVMAASAFPVRWVLSGVTFAGGGTASGSFVYDADANTFSSVSITTTSTGSFTGQTYVTVVPPPTSGASFVVSVTTGAFTTGTPDFFLLPATPLTDAGGTLALVVGTNPAGSSSEGVCGNAACSGPGPSPVRQVSAGSLVGTAVAGGGTVPALSVPAMAGLGALLVAAASMLMRRQEKQS